MAGRDGRRRADRDRVKPAMQGFQVKFKEEIIKVSPHVTIYDATVLALPLDAKTDMVLPYVERAGLVSSPATDDERDRVVRLLAAAGDRVKTAGDILAC